MNYQPGVISDIQEKISPDKSERAEKSIFCANCSSHITEKNEILEVDGGWLHLKKNPAGIIFRIICFRNARGCRNFGEYTGEFTWFDGCRWCIVICANCSIHLGWHYTGSDDFYGLIADRIRGI